MTTTATAIKKFALATLAGPLLAALAIGTAGAAQAVGDPLDVVSATQADAPTPAGDQISSLQDEGVHVVVTKDAEVPLTQCSVVSVRQDHPHEHRGGPQHDEFHTAYVDLSCH